MLSQFCSFSAQAQIINKCALATDKCVIHWAKEAVKGKKGKKKTDSLQM